MIIESESHPISVSNSGVLDSTPQLIRYMDKHGIDATIIMPGVGASNVAGHLLQEAAKRSQGRLIPFCRFFYEDPVTPYELPIPPHGWVTDKERSLMELSSMLQSGVFKGVGECNVIEMGVEELSKSIKDYYPFFDTIAKFKVPVQFHTGFGTGMSRRIPVRFFDPVNIDEFACRYPEIPFIINHCGGMISPASDSSLYVTGKHDNVFLIISNVAMMRDEMGRETYIHFVEKALRAYGVGADRLIFGSDWQPRHDTNGFCSAHHEALKKVKMDETERETIMGENMRKLLKI